MSHTGVVGGAERSLLELMRGVQGTVEMCLVTPDGELAKSARALGIGVVVTRPVELAFRLGPTQTFRGAVGALRVARDVRTAARRFGADVVHANSVRAGFAAIVAWWFGAPRPIVHVRDAIPEGAAGRFVALVTLRGARLVLANSAHTASAFRARGDKRVRVIHNPVDVDRFAAAASSRVVTRRALGIPPATAVLTVVAQLTPWKGQDDAIRILAHVRAALPDVRLLLVGEAKFVERFTRYDNAAYAADLRRLADELGVMDAVEFLGERGDVPEILSATDVLLVPSWQEPFGRIVIEAMAAGAAVVATSVGGPAELIEDGDTGLLLRPKDPQRWGDAVLRLLADSERRSEIAARAADVVAPFRPDVHAAAIVSYYCAIGAR